jgi:5-methylcytosine-specific restriction endonuclease McrA
MGLTKTQKEELKRKRGYVCQLCGQKFDPDYLVIHHRFTRPEWERLKGTVKKVEQPLVWEILWGPRYEKMLTVEKEAERDKEENLLVLCVKCHKKLDQLTSHGKGGGGRRKKPPELGIGLTDEQFKEITGL